MTGPALSRRKFLARAGAAAVAAAVPIPAAPPPASPAAARWVFVYDPWRHPDFVQWHASPYIPSSHTLHLSRPAEPEQVATEETTHDPPDA